MDDFMNDSLFQDIPKKGKLKGTKTPLISEQNSLQPIRE